MSHVQAEAKPERSFVETVTKAIALIPPGEMRPNGTKTDDVIRGLEHIRYQAGFRAPELSWINWRLAAEELESLGDVDGEWMRALNLLWRGT